MIDDPLPEDWHDLQTGVARILFTYEEFQARYLPTWLERYFMPTLGDAADALVQYTEPINSLRAKYESGLNSDQSSRLTQLQDRYAPLGEILVILRGNRFLSQIYPHLGRPTPTDFCAYKKLLEQLLDGARVLRAQTYRDLLKELLDAVAMVTNDFNAVFGKNIFTE